jgi:AhpD family alkylhydroperoxidase
MEDKSRNAYSELEHCQRVSPEQVHVCQNFLAAYETCLDCKTEQLVKVALSVGAQCEWCIAFFVKKALDSGSTHREIIDAARMAVKVNGAPALGCMEFLNNVLAKSGAE